MVGVSTHRDVDIYPVGEGTVKIILDVGMWGIKLGTHFQHEKLGNKSPFVSSLFSAEPLRLFHGRGG